MISLNYKKAATLSDAIDNLYEIITLLRSPDGCPWDRVQTKKDVTECILDETYEYLDGVLKESINSEREEIGDIMINVFMNLRIHEEQKDFEPYEAINDVCEKLIRRHPHVFSTSQAENVDQVLDLWNSVKENVEGHTINANSIFGHIPGHLPQLMEAYEIQKKLEKVGLQSTEKSALVDELDSVWDKLKNGYLNDESTAFETDLGLFLYNIVKMARSERIKAETALHKQNLQVKEKFQKLFDLAYTKNIPIDKEHAEVLLQLMKETQ